MQPREDVLFAVFLISLLATIGLGIYCYGALVGVRSHKLDGFHVPPQQLQLPYVSLPHPPEPPVRAARGTTPPPLPPGVTTNREDATDPEIPSTARFSVTRSNQRRL